MLLAVQPSSLGPEQMEQFIAAVAGGQPTAIFEDPLPVFAGDVPGTSMPRQPPGGMNPMMMMQQQPQPKGDIEQLWSLLGVDFAADQVVWQDYNPYPQAQPVLAQRSSSSSTRPRAAAFDASDPISSNLQHVLFPFPGAITKLNASDVAVHAAGAHRRHEDRHGPLQRHHADDALRAARLNANRTA